jgi:hypothetical protein
MAAIRALKLAGVEELSLGINPEAVVGTEDLAELLRGFAVKGGDFRQARAESGDGGLATRLGGKPDACGKSRFGRSLTVAGRCGGNQECDGYGDASDAFGRHG